MRFTYEKTKEVEPQRKKELFTFPSVTHPAAAGYKVARPSAYGLENMGCAALQSAYWLENVSCVALQSAYWLENVSCVALQSAYWLENVGCTALQCPFLTPVYLLKNPLPQL
jgi:hypothetical protein